MNRKQLIVLWVGIGIAAAMGIVPPWQGGSGSRAYSLGYAPLWSPPDWYAHFDFGRLGIQWAVVAMIAGGLLATFRGDARGGRPVNRGAIPAGFADQVAGHADRSTPPATVDPTSASARRSGTGG